MPYKIYRKFLTGLALLAALTIGSQTPTYFNTAAQGGANTFPFNNFSTSRQVSWFIPAGSLGTLPSAMIITRVYINFSSAATLTCPTFEIKLKMGAVTGMLGSNGSPVETGFTLVFAGSNYVLSTAAGQWKQFTLQTPFVWTNTSLPIIVQFQHNATSGSGPNVNQPVNISGPGNGRHYANFNGTTNTSVGPNQVDFGIDGIPLNIISSGVSCAAAGSATASISGSGPYSFTWMPGGQTSSVATGLIPGTYTLAVHDASLGVTYTVTQTFTSSVPFTGTLQTTSALSCNGVNTGTAGIILSGGSGSSSYLWKYGNATFTTSTLSGLAAGNYSVSVTDNTTGCSQSHTFALLSPPALTLSVAASSPTACVSGQAILSGSVSGGTPGYTYSWTAGPPAAQHTVTQGSAGSYVYSLTAWDSQSCNVTNTIGLSFVSLPVLSVQNMSICPGETTTLTVSGASTYTWLPGGSAGPTYSASPSTTSVYSVSGTASACVSNATAAVVIKPLPSLTFNTFSITCASLGSATAIVSGGAGPFNYTWMPAGQTASTAGGLNPGAYTVTVFDAGTGCITNSVTQFNSLIPLTGSLYGNSSVTCFSYSTAAAGFTNLAGGSPNQNYVWTNGSAGFTTNPVNTLGAGQWSVTVTDALTGCQVYSLFTISQPPAITLSLAAGTPSVCAGGSVFLSSIASGGTPGFSYQWTNGPSQATYAASQANAGNHVFTVAATDANSCLTSGTVLVNFIPNPVLSVTNSSICPLETGTVTVAGAASYTWSNNSGLTSLSASPPSTTIYTVTGEALGCMSVRTATITIKPVPIALWGSNTPRCEQTQLNLFAAGGTGYLWNGPQGFSSVVQNPVISSVQLNQAGVYNVTVTAANGCTASAAGTVVVNLTPTIAAAGSTVCTTQTLNLSANSFPGATFVWTGPAGFSSPAQNPTLANPVVAATGDYTVKATSVQGCTNTTVVNGLVVFPPSLFTSLSSPSLCAQAFNGSPNSITLNASGGSTYTLYTPGHIISTANPPWALTSVPPYTPQITISTATLFGSNGICATYTTASFSVVPNPTVSVSNSTPVICAGESFTYTSSGASSYVWSSSSPNYTSFSNGGVAVTNPNINSVFSVIGSSLGCQSALVTSSITVHPLPDVSVTPSQTNICIGSPAVLVASGNSTDYKWSPPNNLSSTSGATVLAKPDSEQQYIVTGSANSCTRMAVASVTVLPLPLPTATANSAAVCLDDKVIFKGTGGLHYSWKGANNISFAGETVTVTASSLIYSGDYTLTVTDKNGCMNTARTGFIIHEFPSAGITGTELSGCAPFCSDIRLWTRSNSVTGRFTVNGRGYDSDKFNYCFQTPGTYTINGYFTDHQTGCQAAESLVLRVPGVPQADFYWLPEKPVEALEDVQFINSTLDDNQIQWSWYFSNDKTYKPKSENAFCFFRDAGTYPVALIVSNSAGCSDTIVKTVVIESDFACYIPNAFTPNTDSKNEIFLPKVRGVHKYSLSIFNRWGEQVFYTQDHLEGWAGEFRGEQCKSDVYAYKIVLTTLHGEHKEYAGQVILYR
jgi:gliding motility-associated-like protein